jgi:hypothetical protein
LVQKNVQERNVMDTEDVRIKLEVAKHAKHGVYNLLISIPELHKNVQTQVLMVKETTTVETLIWEEIQCGATQLIQRRDGNIVIQLAHLIQPQMLCLMAVNLLIQIKVKECGGRPHSRVVNNGFGKSKS